MFAVFRDTTDGCTYTYRQLLFVTSDEQVAKDAVALAQLELEEARKIPRPTWTIEDIKQKGPDYATQLRETYEQAVSSTLTIDPDYSPDGDEAYYEYEPVAVK